MKKVNVYKCFCYLSVGSYSTILVAMLLAKLTLDEFPRETIVLIGFGGSFYLFLVGVLGITLYLSKGYRLIDISLLLLLSPVMHFIAWGAQENLFLLPFSISYLSVVSFCHFTIASLPNYQKH